MARQAGVEPAIGVSQPVLETGTLPLSDCLKNKKPSLVSRRGFDFLLSKYFQLRPDPNRVCDAHEACADVEVQVVESFMFMILNIRLFYLNVKEKIYFL